MKPSSSFASKAALGAASHIFMAGLVFIAGILLARLLGPEQRGVLAAIQLWPSLLATIALMGLPDGLVYFSASAPGVARRYLNAAVTLVFVSAIFYVLVGLVVQPLLLARHSDSTLDAAQLYLLLIPINALLITPMQTLRGVGRFATWNALRTLTGVTWFAVVLYAFIAQVADPRWIAFAFLVGLAIFIVPVLSIAYRAAPRGEGENQRETRRSLLRYSLPSAAGSLPLHLNLRLDQMLLVAFLPPRLVGLYAVAVTWSNALVPGLTGIGAAFFPQVASGSDPTTRGDEFVRGSRFGQTLVLPFAALHLIVTPFLFPLLFGDRFAPALPAALLLVIAGSVLGFNLLMEEGTRGLGHPKIVMKAELTGLAVTLVALATLLGPFEIVGAAIASMLGYVTTASMLVFLSARVMGRPIRELLRPDPRLLVAGVRSALRARSDTSPEGAERDPSLPPSN